MTESKIEQLVKNAAFLPPKQKEVLLRLTKDLPQEKLKKIEEFLKNARKDLTDMVHTQNTKRQKLISKHG